MWCSMPSQSWDPQNPNDVLGDPYGYKSMNAHIHIMEALTVLVPLQPEEPPPAKRLDEVHLIVRDKMAVKPGCPEPAVHARLEIAADVRLVRP